MSINTSLCAGHLGIHMAAITATSTGSYGIPWPLKWVVSNKQNVSTCLSFGVVAENRSKMAAILNFKMAATRGREYVGGIFFQLPLGGSTASRTQRHTGYRFANALTTSWPY